MEEQIDAATKTVLKTDLPLKLALRVRLPPPP